MSLDITRPHPNNAQNTLFLLPGFFPPFPLPFTFPKAPGNASRKSFRPHALTLLVTSDPYDGLR